LPYVNTIKGGIKPDMAVIVQGTLPAHAQSFEINFKTGESDSDDIAFHFNPRIGQYVYLNSFRDGSWEKEECVSDKSFNKGAGFYMFFVIHSDNYEVYVNGLRLCTFKHRIPVEKVSTLGIRGDAFKPIYGFIDVGTIISYMHNNEHSLCFVQALPYVGSITGGLKPGMSLFLRGTVPTHAKGFEINLKTGFSDDDDIAFHFNPRIGQYVYLNSFRKGSWEKEQTAPDKPFTKGAAFKLLLVIKTDRYEVYVNDVLHCVFKHRVPLEEVTTLAILGDVSLLFCGFINVSM
ncbi:hypothetical protein C0J50_24165, partial [Silurus asotus]